MSFMITASDVLHILSEIHQYSMLLVELRDTTILGVTQSPDGKLNYFKIQGSLSPAERRILVDKMYEGEWPATTTHLLVEDFLLEIEGKKPKHIWLETGGADRRELGFMSISELKSHFRSHTHS
jgi:hypothetical protein